MFGWEDTCWNRWPQWRLVVEEQPGSVEEKIARDAAVGAWVAGGGTPTYRLWVNDRCLVVSRRDVLQGWRRTRTVISGVDGWPVRVRSSGGTAVPHGPGILQFSLVIPRVEGVTMDQVYRTLCRPLQLALGEFGWRAEFGRVPGAFCDGAHNLVVGGRKVAGTSQSWKGGLAIPGSSGKGYILAHGTLWVRVDPGFAARLLNDFYELVSGERPVRAEAAVSLHLLPGGEGVDVPQLIGRLVEILRGPLGPEKVRVEAVTRLQEEEILLAKKQAADTDPFQVVESLEPARKG